VTAAASPANPIGPYYLPATLPICPRCDRLIERRVTIVTGSGFIACEQCGQFVHYLAAEGVLALVLVSAAQVKHYNEMHARAADVYIDLGLMPPPPAYTGPAVPDFACTSCGAMTSIRGLYGGQCLVCYGGDAFPPASAIGSTDERPKG
jgi:hypothetical protein